MKLDFTKMHGCGNDYIFFNCFEQEIKELQKLAITLSDRHKSVGGDGIILVCPSEFSHCKMRIFNADGSEAKMCGNGIRCVGKYYYENIKKINPVRVETLSDTKIKVELRLNGGIVTGATVDMGAPVLDPELVPSGGERLTIGDYTALCVSMGNPHAVVFTVTPVEEIDLPAIGSKFEHHPFFPEGVNTEFVNFIDSKTLKMRVWERGSGETQACGTGACAVAVVACVNGVCERNTDITVKLLGGDLVINWNKTLNTVFMTGDAVEAFRGTVEV